MIENLLIGKTIEAVENLYGQPISANLVQVQKTRREFEGDLTLVVFPFVKMSKKSPEITANEIGNYLQNNLAAISGFNVLKAF